MPAELRVIQDVLSFCMANQSAMSLTMAVRNHKCSSNKVSTHLYRGSGATFLLIARKMYCSSATVVKILLIASMSCLDSR